MTNSRAAPFNRVRDSGARRPCRSDVRGGESLVREGDLWCEREMSARGEKRQLDGDGELTALRRRRYHTNPGSNRVIEYSCPFRKVGFPLVFHNGESLS